jgi:hypothetical protein
MEESLASLCHPGFSLIQPIFFGAVLGGALFFILYQANPKTLVFSDDKGWLLHVPKRY